MAKSLKPHDITMRRNYPTSLDVLRTGHSMCRVCTGRSGGTELPVPGKQSPELKFPVVPQKYFDILPDEPAMDTFRDLGTQPVDKIHRIGGYGYPDLFGFLKNEGDRIEEIGSLLQGTPGSCRNRSCAC